jgi:RNA polymerase sigma factor (sigma-70 family)
MPSLPKLFRSPADSVDDAARRLDQFAEKYQQFFPRVFAYVYGRIHNVHQSEDLVSEVFERAFLKMGSLRNDDAFATWLFTIARNLFRHATQTRRESSSTDILKSVAPLMSVENGCSCVRVTAVVDYEVPQRAEYRLH